MVIFENRLQVKPLSHRFVSITCFTLDKFSRHRRTLEVLDRSGIVCHQ